MAGFTPLSKAFHRFLGMVLAAGMCRLRFTPLSKGADATQSRGGIFLLLALPRTSVCQVDAPDVLPHLPTCKATTMFGTTGKI